MFFRITDLATEDEAVGAEGVAAGAGPLDRGRSFAARLRHAVLHRGRSADRQRKGGDQISPPVVAQDTGSAIVGPARADIYFGAGDEAARIAGRIKNAGEFVMLMPRELDPVEAGRDMPLPPERPSAFSLSVTTMDDPTAVDVPLPEPKRRSVKAGGRNPPPLPRRRAEAQTATQNNEPAPAIER